MNSSLLALGSSAAGKLFEDATAIRRVTYSKRLLARVVWVNPFEIQYSAGALLHASSKVCQSSARTASKKLHTMAGTWFVIVRPNSRICCSFALENRPKSGSIAPACLAMKMSNGVMTTRKEILIFHFSFFKRGLAHPREPHKKLCIGQSQTIMGGARTQDSGSGRRPDRVRKCCSVTSKLTRGW